MDKGENIILLTIHLDFAVNIETINNTSPDGMFGSLITSIAELMNWANRLFSTSAE